MDKNSKDRLILNVYAFMRERDARIIELFFFALNMYILAVVVLPPYQVTGLQLAWRLLLQTLATLANLAAIVTEKKIIRVASAVWNTAIMALISTGLVISGNPNSGTYILLTLLAAFVCWKIEVR